MYDPKTANESEICGKGRKVAAGCGFRRWESSKGTPILDVEFVVLQDLAGGSDQTMRFRARFFLTSAAMWRLGKLCLALGWQEPFDPMSDDAIERILARGAVQVELDHDEYDGKKYATPTKWFRYSGQEDPDWDQIIQAAEDDYQEFIARMEEKGWGRTRTSPSATASHNGGGSSDDPKGGGQDYDDIPF